MNTVLTKRIFLCALWVLGAAAGGAVLRNYEGTAGQFTSTPRQWPAASELSLDPVQPTLLMFVHPHCPCSRASIDQLNRVLARAARGISAHVLFLRPEEVSKNWTRSGLWRNAAAIPGVLVHEDLNGAEARRFGAQTSGYVMLYHPGGDLLFQGGITAGRGHEGDNAGADAILALLAGRSAEVSQTPVFGCSLINQCRAENLAWKQ